MKLLWGKVSIPSKKWRNTYSFSKKGKKGIVWMNGILVKLYIISFPFFLYKLPNTLEKIHHVFHSIPFLRKRLPKHSLNWVIPMLCSFYFSNSINNINVSACVRDNKKETLNIYLIGLIQNPPRRNIC